MCQGRCFVSGDGEKACGGFGPPPHYTPSLNILFGCMGFFWLGGWGEEGKREEGRVKDCLNKVHMCYFIKCFCSPFFVDHINVLA